MIRFEEKLIPSQFILSGVTAFNYKRNLVQEKLKQWKKTHKPEDYYNNIFYFGYLTNYKINLQINTDLILSTSFLGGLMEVEWTALVMNTDDNYPKYTDINTLIMKGLTVHAINSNFKHFDNVTNRSLIFNYYTPYLSGGSNVNTKFNFKR